MSCHVMSCHVVSCLVMSCHVMSCHVTSCPVMSCHVTSRHVTSSLLMPHCVPSYLACRHVTSHHRSSRRVVSSLACHAMSRHVMSRAYCADPMGHMTTNNYALYFITPFAKFALSANTTAVCARHANEATGHDLLRMPCETRAIRDYQNGRRLRQSTTRTATAINAVRVKCGA